jgi:hypothetical protein
VIRAIGFIDTSRFTAHFMVKFEKHMQDGVLPLRDENGDLPIIAEWLTAKAMLGRFKTGAAALNNGKTLTLGKAWIERLPGGHGTPWTVEEDTYAQEHIRTRTCMISVPDAYSFSGGDKLLLNVGVINVVEHRVLHSEVNFSTYPRVHLIVDVRRPEPDGD